MCPKIVYDRKNCEGFFVCSAMDPYLWKEDRDADKVDLEGAGEVKDDLFELAIQDDKLQDALDAAKGCPADVIKVLDDEGNVVGGPQELPIEH